MIVDDEDIIVSGLVKVMPWAKYGCEVAATASDGLAAQAVLREKRPDILFTDICMPGEMCIRDSAMTVLHSNPARCKERIVQLLKGLVSEGYGLHLFCLLYTSRCV